MGSDADSAAARNSTPALIVACTLQYELLFYSFFGIAMALRHPLLGVLLWGAVLIEYHAVVGAPSTALGPSLSLMVLEFVIGVIAAYTVAAHRLQNAAFFAVATLAIYLGLGALEAHRLVFGLAMGFGVVAMVRAERAGQIRVPATLTFLGAASYPIYVVHNPVGSLAAQLLDHRLASSKSRCSVCSATSAAAQRRRPTPMQMPPPIPSPPQIAGQG